MVFPAVVGAASVHAVPAEAEVWLQMVCDAETDAMAPHAGVEQKKEKSKIRRLVKRDTPRSRLCWSGLRSTCRGSLAGFVILNTLIVRVTPALLKQLSFEIEGTLNFRGSSNLLPRLR
jgi:hypothetical protein